MEKAEEKSGLKKDLLLGVTEHCVADFISNQKEARQVLVNTIAANIYETLRTNSSISSLLTDVLDPTTTDKDSLLKNLMSRVTATLEGSLRAPGTSNSGPLSTESSSSIRSTPASTNASFEKPPADDSGRQSAGEEDLADVVYETSCHMEVKEYEMGKQIEKHEVPEPVAELTKSIHTSVEELSQTTEGSASRWSVLPRSHSDLAQGWQSLRPRTVSDSAPSDGPDATRSAATLTPQTMRRAFGSLSDLGPRVVSLPPRPSHSFSHLSNSKSFSGAILSHQTQHQLQAQPSKQPHQQAQQQRHQLPQHQQLLQEHIQEQQELKSGQQDLLQQHRQTLQQLQPQNHGKRAPQHTQKTESYQHQSPCQEEAQQQHQVPDQPLGLVEPLHPEEEPPRPPLPLLPPPACSSQLFMYTPGDRTTSCKGHEDSPVHPHHEGNQAKAILDPLPSSYQTHCSASSEFTSERSRCDRSLSPLSVGPVPTPLATYLGEKAELNSGEERLALLRQEKRLSFRKFSESLLSEETSTPPPHNSSTTESTSTLINDVATSEKLKEVGVATKPKEIGVASRQKEIGVASQQKEIGLASQQKEIGVASQQKEIGVAAQQKKVGVAFQQQEIGLAAHQKEIGVASQQKEIGVTFQQKEIGVAAQQKEISVTTASVLREITGIKETAHSIDSTSLVLREVSATSTSGANHKATIATTQSPAKPLATATVQHSEIPVAATSTLQKNNYITTSSSPCQKDVSTTSVVQVPIKHTDNKIHNVPITLVDKSSTNQSSSCTITNRVEKCTTSVSYSTSSNSVESSSSARFIDTNQEIQTEFGNTEQKRRYENSVSEDHTEQESGCNSMRPDISAGHHFSRSGGNAGQGAGGAATKGQTGRDSSPGAKDSTRQSFAPVTPSQLVNFASQADRTHQPPEESWLPPLEDPSVILLSPNPVRRSLSSKTLTPGAMTPERPYLSHDDDYTDLESLAEEVHQVKEDKARNFLHNKLTHTVSTDMLAYQKYDACCEDETVAVSGGHRHRRTPRSHFEELRQQQLAAQQEFHHRLLHELQQEAASGGGIGGPGDRQSLVASALGTSYKVRPSPSQFGISHESPASLERRDCFDSRTGCNDNNNTGLQTWMDKSPFWSNSLPRMTPRRRVQFEEENYWEPAPPPPPLPPERQQSISTMKDLASVSQAYNQQLRAEQTRMESSEGDRNPQESRGSVSPSSGGRKGLVFERRHDSFIQQPTARLHSTEEGQLEQQHQEHGALQHHVIQQLPLQQPHYVQTYQNEHLQQPVEHQGIEKQSIVAQQQHDQQQRHQLMQNGKLNSQELIQHQHYHRDRHQQHEQQYVGENVVQQQKEVWNHNTAGDQEADSRQYRRRLRSVDSDCRLDLGERKDRWMELYGNSLLDNTLHDRLGRGGGPARLQKSQSAVWSRSEIIEHGPVQSTDRLEKPRRVQLATAPSVTAPSATPSVSAPPALASVAPCSATLPRRWGASNRIVLNNNGQFKLRRNGSLADIRPTTIASAPDAGTAPKENSDVGQARQIAEQQQRVVQVPAHVVKSIVVSVLQQQGIPNPSEEILNAAIQEYYAKNPQGVFVGSASDGLLQPGDRIVSVNSIPTDNLTHVEAQNLFRSSGTSALVGVGRLVQVTSPPVSPGTSEEDQLKVHSQPYRTAPLVMPGPKTINEVGAGAPSYRPLRGPQYNTLPTRGSFNKPLGQYNSPRPLYSEESIHNTPPHPGYSQTLRPSLPSNKEATFSRPQESETFKIVLESEMASAKNQPGLLSKQFEKTGPGMQEPRPASQLSDRSSKGFDPLLKNTSINQSASFKKVMYSVLGESEF